MAKISQYIDLDLSNQKLQNALANPLTTTQRLAVALGAAQAGYICWDTTTSSLFGWTGSAWVDLGGLPPDNTAPLTARITLSEVSDTATSLALVNRTFPVGSTGVTAIGKNVLQNGTFASGASNRFTGLGTSAGENNGGRDNTFIGNSSGKANTTGVENVFVGGSAGLSNTIGAQNTFLGYQTGLNCSTGTYNTFFGCSTGYTANGSYNTAVGTFSMYNMTTGVNNAALGSSSLPNLTTGNNNVAMGYQAGSGITTGNNNVIIGTRNDVLNVSDTCIIATPNSNNELRVNNNVFTSNRPFKPPSYTLSTLPSAAIVGAGAVAFATDARGGQGGNVTSNGTSWAINNPLTAVGDITIGGTNGDLQRLAIGTRGQQLTVVSGTPAWIDSASISVLTYAAALVWDVGLTENARLTLTGNVTSVTINNPLAGHCYTLMLQQDSTGSRTVTWGTAFAWPGGTLPTLSTAANAKDIVVFYYDGTKFNGVANNDFK